jgi:hypothetical protein
MTVRPRTRRDLEARVLPMLSDPENVLMAETLGHSFARLINGRLTIVRPTEDS